MTTETRHRISIIGCGYIGSAIGEAFVQAGHDVVGTVLSPQSADALTALGIRPKVLDVADVERLRSLLVDRTALFLTVAPSDRGVDYRKLYAQGAKNLVAAIQGTSVRRIIYTSSTRVYHQDNGRWVDETSPTQPTDERGMMLLQAEETLLGAAGRPNADNSLSDDDGLCASVVRMTGIYGPDRDTTRRVLAAAGTQRDDGDVYVNMIHRDDIVAALTALLDVQHHGVLNLNDDQPTTRRDYYDSVLEEAMLPPIRWVRNALSPKRGKRVSNDRIKGLLGLTLKHPTHC